MTPTHNPGPALVDELRAAFDDPDRAAAARLHGRLSDSAQRDGLLDVAYRIVDSPFGTLLLAATATGLARLAFAREEHDSVLAHLATEISPRILCAPRRLDDAARQLDEYFAGRRRDFEVLVDLRLAHGFRRAVLDHLRAIPYGGTRSYAAVASAAGHPKAVRAVGSACSHNPLPIVVPCHRVVRSDGTIGNYRGGTQAKQTLLAMEAAP